MDLTFIRHTQPDIAEGICYGQTDLPVADSFEYEVTAILNQGYTADVLISSPLQRCTSLANKLGHALNLPVVIDNRVKEMNFGRWEGIAWDAIPLAELDAWRDDFYTSCPHGGESVKQFTERVRSAIAEFQHSNKSHIIVCHAGVIKVANSHGTTADDYATTVAFGKSLTLTFPDLPIKL